MPEILDYVGAVIPEAFKLSSLNARAPAPGSDWVQPLHCDSGALPDERLRLLYVGLTRAKMACHVVLGSFGSQGQSSALLSMLGVDEDKSASSSALLAERLAALTGRDGNAISLADLPAAATRRWRRGSRSARSGSTRGW